MSQISKLLSSKLSLSIGTGLLLILAWPPISLTPLLFVVFVPLLWAIKEVESAKKAFLYTYLAFFIWTLGTMYWIANTQLDFQGLLIVSIAFILIPLFQSLPILFFYFFKRKFNRPAVWYLLPFIWVAYEFLHSNWELSFTWLHLGQGLTPMPWMIQFYELTGYLGGALLIWFFNILIFQLVKRHKSGDKLKPVIISVVILTTAFAIINLLLYPDSSDSRDKKAKVAIVQNSTDSYEELDRETLNKQLELVRESVMPLKDEKVDLIVFPEGFLRTSPKAPLIINNPDKASAVNELKAISKEVNAPILIGFVGYKLHGSLDSAPSNALPIDDGRYYSIYNGAMLVSYAQTTQIQLKNNLVPFMERVPFLDFTSFFETFRLKLNQARVSYGKDEKVRVFQHGDLKIGTLICLDALFPDYTRGFLEDKANLYVIIANDSWAGKTSGFVQNANYAKSIALSLHKDIVRAATTGVSMFVESSGNTEKATRWQDKTVIVKDVGLKRSRTIYAIFGNVIGYLSVMIFLTCTIVLIFKLSKS